MVVMVGTTGSDWERGGDWGQEETIEAVKSEVEVLKYGYITISDKA